MMTPEEQAYVRKLEETIVKLKARIADLGVQFQMYLQELFKKEN